MSLNFLVVFCIILTKYVSDFFIVLIHYEGKELVNKKILELSILVAEVQTPQPISARASRKILLQTGTLTRYFIGTLLISLC